MRTLVFAAVVAVAFARVNKPEIRTANDDIHVAVPENKDVKFQRSTTRATGVAAVLKRLAEVEKQLETIPTVTAITEFSNQVDALRTKLTNAIASNENGAADALGKALGTSVNAAKQGASQKGQTVFQDVKGKLSGPDQKLQSLQNDVSGKVDQQIKATKEQSAAALKDMQTKLSGQVNKITQTIAAQSKTTAEKLKALNTKVTKDLGGAVTKLNNGVKALDATVKSALKEASTAVAQAAFPKRLVWSGGCRQSKHRDGWMPYCHNGQDFSTLDEYIQRIGDNENSAFRVKKSGYYRVNHYYIGQRRWNHMGIWHNNRHIHHGHEYTDGNWHDQFADLTWKFNAGDKFWVQIYGDNHGHWNYHSWSSGGSHSRLQIEYIGALN